MGYYTRLKLSVQLNKEAPLDTLNKLAKQEMYKHITGKDHPAVSLVGDTPNLPIDHPFGKTHRWDQIFNGATFNLSRKTLKIDCEIKAYEDDYTKLLDWLKPYIVSGKAKSKGEAEESWTELIDNKVKSTQA